MPKQIEANAGESLCVIAMRNGFLDCQPLREEPANAVFLTRHLEEHDIVTIPDLRVKFEGRPTDAAHVFLKKNSPPPRIRFVHGSPDRHYLDDDETTVLNVSNFRSDRGGSDANAPFPNQFEFHPEGHVDPDTFKIEIVDPQAAGKIVEAELQALMPVYDLITDDGRPEPHFAVTGHKFFRGDARPLPILKADCAAVHSAVSFRSKYLRLVTSKSDVEAIRTQALQVATPADGTGTGKAQDLDTIEILDLAIRAVYKIPTCPAPDKCAVSVTRPLGDDSDKRRFRIAFHIFKTPGTGSPIENLTPQSIRKGALRELRSIFAQALMSPKLVSADGSPNGSAIIAVDDPDDSMIVIGEKSGRGASGRNSKGQSSVLTIRDRLTTIAEITLSRRMRPVDVGNATKQALDGDEFTVTVFENRLSDPEAAAGSCDVLVKRRDKNPLSLSVLTDDTVLRSNVIVPRVNVQVIDENRDVEARRIIRSSPGPEGVINVYSVGSFRGNTAAFAIPPSTGFPERLRDKPPIVNSVLCAAPFLGDKPHDGQTVAHECCHILADVGHVPDFDPHSTTELMTGKDGKHRGRGVAGSRRISDAPILVHYEQNDPADSVELINAVERLHSRGENLLESW